MKERRPVSSLAVKSLCFVKLTSLSLCFPSSSPGFIFILGRPLLGFFVQLISVAESWTIAGKTRMLYTREKTYTCIINVNNVGNSFTSVNSGSKIKKNRIRKNHVCFHISSFFNFLSLILSCHARVLLIVHALRKRLKQIKRLERSTWWSFASMWRLFSRLINTYADARTRIFRLISLAY